MKIKRTISAFLTAVILLISNSVLAAPASQDIPAAPEETTPPQVITSDVPEPPDDFVSTGNGSWYSDGIYNDSAEALGVDVNRAYLCENNNEYYGDLSEYVLENEYFIIDESLQGYLSNNISPEVFNKFMHQMVLGYEAMYDLIGQKPGNGTKVLMRDMTPECYNGAHMHTHPDYIICWQTNDIISILRNLQERNADDWWLEGAMHELGHVFENVAPWNWAGEGWASYFAWLAIMKNDAKLYCSLPQNPNDEIYEGFFDDVEIIEHNKWDIWENRYVDKAYFDNPIKYYWYKNLVDHLTSSDSDFYDKKQHYMVYLLNPIFEHIGWNEGWKKLQKVFDSYYNMSYVPAKYNGNTLQLKLSDFVDRCSFYVGFDIKDYWIPSTKTHFTNALIPPSKPHVVQDPLYPRVGDEITFSVYNCPNDQNYQVCFDNGPERFYKEFFLSKGDNLNIPYGYQITDTDIGNRFDLLIFGFPTPETVEWATFTEDVRRPKIELNFKHNLYYEKNSVILNTIELSAPTLLSKVIYYKVDQLTPNQEITLTSGHIQIDYKGNGIISFPTFSLSSDNLGGYIKISIYKDPACQMTLAQQLIAPTLFNLT